MMNNDMKQTHEALSAGNYNAVFPNSRLEVYYLAMLQRMGGSTGDTEFDEVLKHFLFTIDVENKQIILYKILYDEYQLTEVMIPDELISGFTVVINSKSI